MKLILGKLENLLFLVLTTLLKVTILLIVGRLTYRVPKQEELL